MPRTRVPTLVLLCSAQFVMVLDVGILAVAPPAVRDSLGLSTGTLPWVITAYVLAFAGLLLLAGRAADLWGRRRMFAIGLAAFALASLACGLAQAPWQLLTARAVQGAGAAIVAPAALSLLTTAFAEGPDRTRALGAWTAAAAVGGAAGFVLGGLLTDALGWRSVFFVNVPVGIVGLLAAPRLLVESRGPLPPGWTSTAPDQHRRARRTGAGVDPHRGVRRRDGHRVGAAGAVAAVRCGVSTHRAAAHPPAPAAGRLPLPLLVAGSVVAVLLTAVTIPVILLTILHMEDALGWSATRVGFAVTPFNLSVVGGSLAGGRLTAAFGAHRVMPLGLAGVGLGAVALSAIDVWPALILAGFVVGGLGLGGASVASTSAGTAALPGGDQGLASGVLNTAAQVGTALGLAVLVTVASLAGLRQAFLLGAVIATAGIAVPLPVQVRP